MKIMFGYSEGIFIVNSDGLHMYIDRESEHAKAYTSYNGVEGQAMYADYVVETPTTRYRIKRCRDVDDMHHEVEEYLKEHTNDDAVFIDLYCPSGDVNSYFDNDGIVVERLFS